MTTETMEMSDLFANLKAELEGLDRPRTPLLGIAIWGWQGDGKTTSLLTALHFADPLSHALGFSLVREHDEISEMAQRHEFKNAGLLHLAKSSTALIEQLQIRFIDECKWPDGTDSGNAYLVRVEDVSSTRAFAIVTDLPGGSFSENDVVAETVIKNAHALIVMVAPERWFGNGLKARAYQNMVRYRIRRCTELKIPVSVLVAQADKDRSEANKVADALQLTIDQLEAPSGCTVFKVSVIGDERANQSSIPSSIEHASLPPVTDRNPVSLIHAWVWTLVKALKNDKVGSRTRVPVTQLERIAKSAENEPNSLVELRLVGDFSGLKGTMLSPLSGTRSECSFLVAQEGVLVEICLKSDGSVPTLSNLGNVEDTIALLDQASNEGAEASNEEAEASNEGGGVHLVQTDLLGAVFDSEMVVGARTNPGSIWTGHLHDLISPLPLPTAVAAWQPIAVGLIAGIDMAGRLHLFKRHADSWKQEQFIAEFLPVSEEVPLLVYVANSHLLIASDGETTNAIRVQGDSFGDRVEPPMKPNYELDESPILSNNVGSVALLDADRHLHLSIPGLDTNYGPVHPEMSIFAALGTATEGLVAWVDTELRIRVAKSTADGVRLSDDNLSPLLPNTPVAIKWAAGDQLLAVDLGDGTWLLFQLLGL